MSQQQLRATPLRVSVERPKRVFFAEKRAAFLKWNKRRDESCEFEDIAALDQTYDTIMDVMNVCNNGDGVAAAESTRCREVLYRFLLVRENAALAGHFVVVARLEAWQCVRTGVLFIENYRVSERAAVPAYVVRTFLALGFHAVFARLEPSVVRLECTAAAANRFGVDELLEQLRRNAYVEHAPHIVTHSTRHLDDARVTDKQTPWEVRTFVAT